MLYTEKMDRPMLGLLPVIGSSHIKLTICDFFNVVLSALCDPTHTPMTLCIPFYSNFKLFYWNNAKQKFSMWIES